MAYSVTRQTHDIGIRVALGAERNEIIHMVLRKGLLLGLLLIAGGLIIGVAGSLAATRYLTHELQGILSLDFWTYGGVLLLVIAAGVTACFMPARRAAQVDPPEAIRCE